MLHNKSQNFGGVLTAFNAFHVEGGKTTNKSKYVSLLQILNHVICRCICTHDTYTCIKSQNDNHRDKDLLVYDNSKSLTHSPKESHIRFVACGTMLINSCFGSFK